MGLGFVRYDGFSLHLMNHFYSALYRISFLTDEIVVFEPVWYEYEAKGVKEFGILFWNFDVWQMYLCKVEPCRRFHSH